MSAIHACSGSTITAKSVQLEQARKDLEDALEKEAKTIAALEEALQEGDELKICFCGWEKVVAERDVMRKSKRLQVLKISVRKKIIKYGIVEKETKVKCIKNFLDAQRVEDRCCGACGVRDPDGDYTQSCQLATLEESHWAVVPQQALDRLNALSPFQLLIKHVV